MLLALEFCLQSNSLMNESSEQLNDFENENVQTSMSSTNEGSVVKACRLNFEVDNVDCELLFTWNFRNVHIIESCFVRHLLLVELDSDSSEKARSDIYSAYYKHLKLGDFLKVVQIRRKKISKWLEKTNKDFCWKDNGIAKEEGYFDALKETLLKAYKFDEFLSISIVLGCEQSTAKAILSNIDSILKTAKSCFKLNCFIHQKSQNFNLIRNAERFSASIFVFQNSVDLVQEKLRKLFQQFVRIRAQKVEIYLSCLNAQINVRNHEYSEWRANNSNTLVRKLLNLNNYAQYIERLVINCSLDLTYADFKVRFVTKTIEGDIFQTEQLFTVSLKSVSHKFIAPFNYSDAKPLSTLNSNPSKSRNIVLHCEQITLVKNIGRSELELA